MVTRKRRSLSSYPTKNTSQSTLLQMIGLSIGLGILVFYKCTDSKESNTFFDQLITPASLHLPKSVLDLKEEKKTHKVIRINVKQ